MGGRECESPIRRVPEFTAEAQEFVRSVHDARGEHDDSTAWRADDDYDDYDDQSQRRWIRSDDDEPVGGLL